MECKHSINVLSYRNAWLPVWASKGNTAFPPTPTPALPPPFLISQRRICQQQSSQTFCICHQSKWEKGERVSSLETRKSCLDTILGKLPSVALLEQGGLDQMTSTGPCQPQQPTKDLHSVQLSGTFIAISLLHVSTSRSGRRCCSSTAEHFLDLSLKTFDCLSIQRTLLGPFL